MAEARVRDQWNHTAAVMALIANALRDPKRTGPLKPQDFHPLQQRPNRQVVRLDDLSMLKRVFVGQATESKP